MGRSRQALGAPRSPARATRASRDSSNSAFSSPGAVAAIELRRLNWALAAYARSSAALIHSSSFEEMVTGVCRAIVGDDDYLLAAAGLVEDLPGWPVTMIAGAGSASAYLEDLRLAGSEEAVEGQGPAGRAVREGGHWVHDDARDEPDLAPWRRRALAHGIRSSVTL